MLTGYYSHKYLPMRAEFYLPRQTEKQQGILVVVAVKKILFIKLNSKSKKKKFKLLLAHFQNKWL